MTTWPPQAPAATRARGGGYLVSPDLQVRCVTPGTGAPRPPGEPGELQFRGYNVFSCYPGNPAATAALMTADGWFRSGDLGQVQPDGAFIYLARLKDSLRLGGYLVGPKRSRNSCRNTPRSRPPTWSACGGSRRATCRSPSCGYAPAREPMKRNCSASSAIGWPPARCRAGSCSWTSSPAPTAPTAARSKKTGCARSPRTAGGFTRSPDLPGSRARRLSGFSVHADPRTHPHPAISPAGRTRCPVPRSPARSPPVPQYPAPAGSPRSAPRRPARSASRPEILNEAKNLTGNIRAQGPPLSRTRKPQAEPRSPPNPTPKQVILPEDHRHRATPITRRSAPGHAPHQ